MQDVEQRLAHWAAWCHRREDGGLGYRSRTVEADLRDYGGHAPRGTGPKPVILDSEAEHTERLLLRLRSFNHDYYRVVELVYLRSYPQRVIAKELHTNQQGVSTCLLMAKNWLAGKLDQQVA